MTFLMTVNLVLNVVVISALAIGAKLTVSDPNKAKVFIIGSAPSFFSILVSILYLLGVR